MEYESSLKQKFCNKNFYLNVVVNDFASAISFQYIKVYYLNKPFKTRAKKEKK